MKLVPSPKKESSKTKCFYFPQYVHQSILQHGSSIHMAHMVSHFLKFNKQRYSKAIKKHRKIVQMRQSRDHVSFVVFLNCGIRDLRSTDHKTGEQTTSSGSIVSQLSMSSSAYLVCHKHYLQENPYAAVGHGVFS